MMKMIQILISLVMGVVAGAWMSERKKKRDKNAYPGRQETGITDVDDDGQRG